MSIPAATSTSTADTPKSFTSLPAEVLDILLPHLDRPSLLIIARVSSTLCSLAKPHIWRHLNLSVLEADLAFPASASPAHSQAELETSSEASSDSESTSETDSETGDADLSSQAIALRRKLQTVLQRSTAETVRRVRSVDFAPRPGASRAAIKVLLLVSPTLVSLDITPPKSLDGWEADEREAFLFSSRFSRPIIDASTPHLFPSLTHITLGIDAVTNANLLPILCNSAPALTHLVIAIRQDSDYPLPGDASRLVRPTQIRHMRLAFIYKDDDVAESNAFDAMFNVITWSHNLQRLSVDFVVSENETPARGYIIGAVSHLAELADFSWGGYPDDILSPGQNPRYVAPQGTCGVRRLVIEENEQFLYVQPDSIGPIYANLEVLHINTEVPPPIFIHFLSTPNVAQLIDAPIAEWLHLCPRLHTINFFRGLVTDARRHPDIFPLLDTIEAAGDVSMRISSLCRHPAGGEMLIVKMLLQSAKEAGIDTNDPEINGSEAQHEALHVIHVNEPGRAVPKGRQVFTDYDEFAVPLDILERMRRVEGASEEDWNRRGVKVGAAAWEVLLRWWERVMVDAITPRGYDGAEADDYWSEEEW